MRLKEASSDNTILLPHATASESIPGSCVTFGFFSPHFLLCSTVLRAVEEPQGQEKRAGRRAWPASPGSARAEDDVPAGSVPGT